MRRLLVLIAGLTLFVGVVSAAGCGSDDPPGGPAATADPGSGVAASGFSGTTLDGEDVSLESFAGRPLVLVFWASW
jgi:cytochrome oxidase Cu insertion factor (SCO1/SenC/PrrC family)